mmetsp:Transcript_26415/g.39045  ORF Transcript_26415/g.39045 Transcript_26415/m.39045 type:complete len:132 (+) Transcript_26415:417-812(+)
MGAFELGSSLSSLQSSSVRLAVGVARRKPSLGFKLLEQFFLCKEPDEQEFNGMKAKESWLPSKDTLRALPINEGDWTRLIFNSCDLRLWIFGIVNLSCNMDLFNLRLCSKCARLIKLDWRRLVYYGFWFCE